MWLLWWAAVAIVGVSGVIASANGVRFERRVAREVCEMATLSHATTLDRTLIVGLPEPVRRYMAAAVGARQRPVRSVRLRHGGTFRQSLTGTWLRTRGEQHFTADPPGFLWWRRVRMFPGLWIDARDRSVNGVGNMFVTI